MLWVGIEVLICLLGKDEYIPILLPFHRVLSEYNNRFDFPLSFVRDVESAAQRLEDSASNTTVLAPLNSAVESLPQKPWEDPRDYGALGPNAYEGGDGHQRAHRNLQRFVERHMVPVSPWPKGKKVKAIGDDQDVWWEEHDGKKVVSLYVFRNLTGHYHTLWQFGARRVDICTAHSWLQLGLCG